MKKILNREHIEGRIYEHDLEIRESGAQSKNPGTKYIRGKISVATDEAGLNIVDVKYTYEPPTFANSGKANSKFEVLTKIIESGKTILTDGIENATMVRIDSVLGVNDFINQQGEMVSAKENSGGFIHIVNKLDTDEAKRATFEIDMAINGTRMIEADAEKNIANDYLVVKGATFDFRNALLPIELVVKNPGGIKYFEGLDASAQNVVFTKVWGTINSSTVSRTIEEESAFGEPSVRTVERVTREWVLTGAAKEPYATDDTETGLTIDELKKANEDRNVYLADIKKNWEDRQNAIPQAPSGGATATAAQGGFNF